MNFCHNCGEKLLNNPKFCAACGAKLNQIPNSPEEVLEVAQPKEPEIEDSESVVKSKGRYLYTILGGLVFVLVFGSRALWTVYKDKNLVDINDVDVAELLLDKNWSLTAYSNLKVSSTNPLITQSYLESEYDELLNDNSSYDRYKYSQDCEERVIVYSQDYDDDLNEIAYGINVANLEGRVLIIESNQIQSIGINSYIDASQQIQGYLEKTSIKNISEKTLKCKKNYSLEMSDGYLIEWEVDVVYSSISDPYETSAMVSANHEITNDWMLIDCNKFNLTPKIGTRTYNELELFEIELLEDESDGFDIDLSEAEFDYDEL